jgi:hypothetical protein
LPGSHDLGHLSQKQDKAMLNNPGPKVLFLDIETSPSLAWIWSLWSEVKSMDFVEKNWYILCFAAKWLGEEETMYGSLPHYERYKTDPTDDFDLVKDLASLLDEADIVVAHNAKKFDLPKINTRLVINGIQTPSQYKVVDTLLVARSNFKFTSNRLNDLSQFLGLGEKADTGGFDLWKMVMAGDRQAWDDMCDYCIHDVTLLEGIYHKLTPFAKGMPNFGIYMDGQEVCTACGSKNIKANGHAYTKVGKYQRYICKDCGKSSRSRKNVVVAALSSD